MKVSNGHYLPGEYAVDGALNDTGTRMNVLFAVSSFLDSVEEFLTLRGFGSLVVGVLLILQVRVYSKGPSER